MTLILSFYLICPKKIKKSKRKKQKNEKKGKENKREKIGIVSLLHN